MHFEARRYTIPEILWMARGRVLPGIAALLATDLAQLAVPIVIKHEVDRLQAGTETGHDILNTVRTLAGLIVVIVVFRFVWRHYFLSAARLAEVGLRDRLLAHVMALPASYFSKLRTGDVMALATNDLPAIRMALAMGLMAGFDALTYTVVSAAAMAVLDWKLMCLTIIPFPLLFLVMAFALRLIYARFDRVQAAFEDLTEKARESIAGMRVLRAFVQADGDQRDFEEHNERYFEAQMRYVRVDSIYQPTIVLLSGLSTAILLGVGGLQVVRGQTTLGSFTAFVSYLGMLTWPMIAAGWLLTMMQRGAASLARICEVLQAPLEDPGQPAPAGPARGALEARNLTFAYPEQDRTALTELSFSLSAGSSLGLVGEVGSGKSTLPALLLRLSDPPPGTLLLDGRDVRELNLAWLRRQVAWVPQEAFLFSDTITENLKLGNENGDFEGACRLAAVHEEILDFPKQYETLLGERGVTLSGGQKQRVCLARALLKEAPVLVLDDTLSAVDGDTERAIIDRLRQRTNLQTTIVISHRISAVRHLDRILVLKEGRVIQQGTHGELMEQPGYYRDLYELQELEA
ncbi:MAG: ABC transporter ATP-binding protein [Candidatus Xenobia bacterium]